MRDLLSAVAYMHYKSLIHCDLKLENIKFFKRGVEDHVKLLDFGCAQFHQRGSDKLHFGVYGSPIYASPEMLRGRGYNEKTDIWSIGIIFHKLLTGYFPYDAKSPMEIAQKIQT